MVSSRIVRFLGVYHARAGVRDKVAYVLNKVAGGQTCALCDITHGWLGEKPAFGQCKARLPVPFEARHLDELSPELARLSDGRTPCVLIETAAGWSVGIDAADLSACGGRVERLEALLNALYSAENPMERCVPSQ